MIMFYPYTFLYAILNIRAVLRLLPINQNGMGHEVRKKYSIMDVTADIGIITSAQSLKELYENAAFALFDIMCDGGEVRREVEAEVIVEGDDAPSTMVNWLNELLFIFETRSLLMVDFKVFSADSTQVKARVGGEEFDPSRHKVARHVKAVTYHRLKVMQTEGGWEAEILLDV